MGRFASSDEGVHAEGVITPSQQRPFSGVFGMGNVAIISSTQAFLIPATTIRVRQWGAGGGGGGGGGFSMKVLTKLTLGQSVLATIGAKGESAKAGGTTSFGAYFSATGGSTVGGIGVGGDVNTVGGSPGGSTSGFGGGGVANLLGNGGDGARSDSSGESGASGGGGGGNAGNSNRTYSGGLGIAPSGVFNIDLIGCGSGTSGPASGSAAELPSPPNAGNGGGGGATKNGGFPGGGGGAGKPGADGLMIVEW